MVEQSALSLDTILTQAQNLVTGDMDGEVVMMSVERGKYYALNDVGSRIWTLISTPCSLTSVCDRLLSEFDVERAQGEAQILAFVADMLEKGVVTVVGPSRE